MNTDKRACSCAQGYHYSGVLFSGKSAHLYLTWLCEHLGVQAARDDVRIRQLPFLLSTAKRRREHAEYIRVLRRFVGRGSK